MKLLTRIVESDEFERTEENLEELIDVKIHLNLEIDKEERRRANRIEELENARWQLVMDKKEMADMAKEYFQELFSSGGISNPEYILSGIESCISKTTNRMLTENFTLEEIVYALKNMGLTKASGRDGFPALFFQKYWHIVGKEVSNFCLNILNRDGSIEEINTTSIVFNPKVVNPVNLKSFRPISICTIIYKIIAKTMANRFQKVLNICIVKTPSAFMPGRLITNNILLAYELMHSLKQRRLGQNGNLAPKLDMRKTHDRVE
ncbi:reverse transcriptase [Gossypium australe]|uniref:Reverse transcriptase n=1 Tax=Gossypium australe TaxID=47621 RepID=A0A5B6W799_9ROSI|nr:reverse transcriptase [Gossypium australe]